MWRLHPGSDVLTPGRYYFVPESTPFYPGAHYLGSRDWTSDEREGATLGEWDGEQIWDRGEPPLVRPELRIVGTPACVEAGGGGTELTHATGALDDWLPADCYRIDGAHPRVRVLNCPDVALIAEIMAWVFFDEPTARAKAETLVGAGSVALHHLGAGDESVSTSVTCVRGLEAWQWCDGTRNRGQLLSQAYGFAGGPRSYGRYSTTPIYQHYATQILSRFTDAGAAACRRFVLIGHSYGGAAAAVAAARLKILDPTLDVVLYTLGAPAAGDSRLIDLLATCDQTHVRRFDDPVPHLPPPIGYWRDLIFALAAEGFMQLWGRFAPYERCRLLGDGEFRDETPTDGPSGTDMASILVKLVSEDDLPAFSSHFLSTYANDLATNCGLPIPFPTA